jgi:hypothetical protein
VFGTIFESHHFYFLFLFLVYGYLYISTIHLFTENSIPKLNRKGLIFFFGVLLFLLLRPIPNLAFYTGGIFIVFNMLSYYKFREKKYLYFLFFAPLIHIGLAFYLFVPIFLLLFQNKTWYYVVFLIFTLAAGKSNVVGALGTFAESYSGTIIESKFDSYASEEGKSRLDERYSTNAEGKNIKNRILNSIQYIVLNILVPIGVAILFLKRKKLLINKNIKLLFHIVLLFWSVSNLMINISQGERFVILSSFISIGLFFIVYTKTIELPSKTIFSHFLSIFIPVLFLFGLMSAYASNILFGVEFFISNFFIELFFIANIN